MGVDEGNLQVINVEGILGNCPITALYIIYQCTVQYSTVSTIYSTWYTIVSVIEQKV